MFLYILYVLLFNNMLVLLFIICYIILVMVNNMILLYNDMYYYHTYIYVFCTNIHTIINAPSIFYYFYHINIL